MLSKVSTWTMGGDKAKPDTAPELTPEQAAELDSQHEAAKAIQSQWRGARGLKQWQQAASKQGRLYPKTVLSKLDRLKSQHDGFAKLFAYLGFIALFLAMTVQRHAAADHRSLMVPITGLIAGTQFVDDDGDQLTVDTMTTVAQTRSWLHALLRDLYSVGDLDPLWGDRALLESMGWNPSDPPKKPVLAALQAALPSVVGNATDEYVREVKDTGALTEAEISAVSSNFKLAGVQSQLEAYVWKVYERTRPGGIVEQTGLGANGYATAKAIGFACYDDIPINVTRDVLLTAAVRLHALERELVTGGGSNAGLLVDGYIHRSSRFFGGMVGTVHHHSTVACDRSTGKPVPSSSKRRLHESLQQHRAARLRRGGTSGQDARKRAADSSIGTDASEAALRSPRAQWRQPAAPRAPVLEEGGDGDGVDRWWHSIGRHLAGKADLTNQAQHGTLFSPFCFDESAPKSSAIVRGRMSGQPVVPLGGHVPGQTGFSFLSDLGLYGTGWPVMSCAIADYDQEGVLSDDVSDLSLTFAVYNAGLDLVASVNLAISFTVGGEMQMQVNTNTLAPAPPHFGTWDYWVDQWWEFVFIVWVAIFTVGEAKELYDAGPCEYVKDPWNALDILALGNFWFGIVVWFVYTGRTSDWVAEVPTDVSGGTAEIVLYTTTQLATLESWTSLYGWYVMSTSFSTMLAGPRLLKYLQFHERISIITRTISAATVELFHFVVIFCLLNVLFAVWGHYLLGTESEDWATVSGAFETLCRVLLGDFDYEGIEDAQPVEGPFFFWTYTLVMSMLMLNIFLSIVVDAFIAVQESSGDSETLPESLYMFVAPMLRGLCNPLIRAIKRKRASNKVRGAPAERGAGAGAAKGGTRGADAADAKAAAEPETAGATSDVEKFNPDDGVDAAPRASNPASAAPSAAPEHDGSEDEASESESESEDEGEGGGTGLFRRRRLFMYTPSVEKVLRSWAVRATKTGSTATVAELQVLLSDVTGRRNVADIIAYFSESKTDAADEHKRVLKTMQRQMRATRVQLRLMRKELHVMASDARVRDKHALRIAKGDAAVGTGADVLGSGRAHGVTAGATPARLPSLRDGGAHDPDAGGLLGGGGAGDWEK